jgi:nitroreductase
MSEVSLHEAIYSLRAMRRLRTDPVPDAELRALVDAATQAPTAENAQNWAFIVITDPELRRQMGALYRGLGEVAIRDGALASGALDPKTDRVYRNALVLVEELGDAPALILVATRGAPPEDPVAATAYYGSIFPAIQNLMLAARARGLGTTLTTLHRLRERDVKALLGIPDEVTTIALIPVGYPRGRWGRPLRAPAATVTHWDRWGNQRDGASE